MEGGQRRRSLSKFEPTTLGADLLRYRWTKPLSAAVNPDRRLIAMSGAPVRHGFPHISPTVIGSSKLVP
jgi:hypothetical protein